MVKATLPLAMVPPGKDVILVSIIGGRGIRARLTDMGLNEGIKLRILHSQPPGPCIILMGSTRLVLGYGITQKILVRPVRDNSR